MGQRERGSATCVLLAMGYFKENPNFMGDPQGELMGHGPPHLQPRQAALALSYLCMYRSAINQEP